MFLTRFCQTCLFIGSFLLASGGARAQGPAEARYTQDPFGRPLAREVPGGRYLSHSCKNGTLTIKATDGSTRQVQPWTTGVVKISYFAPGRRPVADSSVSVVQEPVKWFSPDLNGEGPEYGAPPASFRAWQQAVASGNVRQTKAALTWHVSGYLAFSEEVVIDKNTLRISLLTGADTLFAEAGPAFRRRPAGPTGADDAAPPGRADELPGTGVRFRLQPGERLYGTGARALPLDRRGYRLELYNQAHYGYQNGEANLNVALPVVLSSRGYLVLFDHYAAAYLDLGQRRPNALEYGTQGLNSLSYFVVTGASQAEILRRYTALTGHQPLPPRWALGLLQSRFGYRSQAEVLDVARRMRAADFPLDALVLDLYWFGGTTRQGDFRWDAAHFPDPAALMRELRGQGVQTILISEPYVMRTSLNDSLVRTQGLVGTTAAGRPYTVGSFWAGPASVLDVFKPQARTWLWAQYRRLHEQGAGGWWSDLGEPENHPLAMHHALGPTPQVHNAYGLTWAGILRDNYAKDYPNERLFNLARSGWAGMQRNAVFPWSGDVSRTWSGLQAQIPIMLGMGQAGVGYMHADAGGFGGNATRDPELYTRWLQLAALSPILRPHSDQAVPPEPYTYPEPYRSIVRRYTHLRYELLPYLYTLAAENTLTGAPLTRAMDFETPFEATTQRGPLVPTPPPTTLNAPDEGGSWNAPADRFSLALNTPATGPPPAASAPRDDQYLLGPNLLVAPINQPGQWRRNVALPATPGGWVDFETGQTLPGGQVVGLPAPLAHVPLLARAGAIVPMTAYWPSTAAFRADTLLVRYFPEAAGPASVFTVYEDDGRSAQALARRQFATIRLTGVVAAGQTTFTATVAGTYPGAPAARLVRLRLLRVAAAPAAVALGGQPLPARAWQYDANRHELRVDFLLRQSALLTLQGLQLGTQPGVGFDPDALTLNMPASRTFGQEISLPYERFTATPAPLRIRNALGQLVRELPTETTPGPHLLRWDGHDAVGQPVPPGYYDAEAAGQHQALVKLAADYPQ